MKWIKPSAGLIAEFKAVQRELAEAEPRKMFGYDALFVNGNMAVGLWQNTCVLKLSPADQQRLLARGAAQPFAPMPGRIMSGWLELSEELAHDPEELLAYSRRAVAFAATLPVKLKRAKAKKAPSKSASKKKATPKRATKKATPHKKTAARKVR